MNNPDAKEGSLPLPPAAGRDDIDLMQAEAPTEVLSTPPRKTGAVGTCVSCGSPATDLILAAFGGICADCSNARRSSGK